MTGEVKIGISGWRYAPWRKVFYPEGLAQRRELEFASRALPTIEINGSFYGLQRPSSYQNWYRQTPDGFVFSVKAHRYITHILRLRGIEQAIANFFASGVFHLREKLGPILWQFPPSLAFDAERFEHFLHLLPHDTHDAATFVRKHAEHGLGTGEVGVGSFRLRHAMEIRHESFLEPAFIALLRRYRVALVVVDSAGKWPDREDVTADFMYLRLHGAEELYASGYTDSALEDWATRIRCWRRGAQPKDARLIVPGSQVEVRPRDVYCYFDNDIKVKAPFDARKLLRKLDLEQGLASLASPAEDASERS
jgi:uncharacterized protein YecE (DUF72 family)